MGCGNSKSTGQGDAPVTEPQDQELAGSAQPAARLASTTTVKPIPTSSLKPVEFGLVTGLEYGDRTTPALLVVQVLLKHTSGTVSLSYDFVGSMVGPI